MELGVDIGDLDALLLYGTPPNMNAYLQRVGVLDVVLIPQWCIQSASATPSITTTTTTQTSSSTPN